MPIGAAVFALDTKTEYFSKHKREDYDAAFSSLDEHFKRGGYKRLIRSPLGIIRDNISLHMDLFVGNILKFHKFTGSTIGIVTYNENLTKTLRCGLTHFEFTRELEKTVYLTQCDPLSLYSTNAFPPFQSQIPNGITVNFLSQNRHSKGLV